MCIFVSCVSVSWYLGMVALVLGRVVVYIPDGLQTSIVY